jgi:hypothetical protein
MRTALTTAKKQKQNNNNDEECQNDLMDVIQLQEAAS